MVEDQILDNAANLHSSPKEDVAERMEKITKEAELERQKLMKAMKSKSAPKKATKQELPINFKVAISRRNRTSNLRY